ncbi:MAG: toll/interleukin-1 receptor domain-containing protein [bacterium]
MKVFISHSWQNKNTAQIISESLKNCAEVWLDINNLKPGDAIQTAIDQAIEQLDVVLVLWSQHAATSAGVNAEIETAVRLKKKVLPVLLEKSPIPEHPLLKGIYGINFDQEDPKPALFRVQAALVRISLGSMDLASASALNDLTSFEGFYQYVQEYRNAKGIGGDDSTDWALRGMEQCNQSFKSLSELRDQVGQTLKFIQDVFARVQAAGDDRNAIQSILNEVIRNPKSDTKEFKVLISFIEGKLSTLPAVETPPVAIADDVRTAASDLARKVSGLSLETTPVRNMRDSAPPNETAPNPALELVNGYIRSAPSSLQKFIDFASSLPSMALKQVANGLHAYLTNPNDLIPDDQNGLLGLIDDAWLIHNTIYRSIEAGFFGAQDIGIQWDRIVQADALVLQMLPPQVRNVLEQVLMQYLQLISNEVAQYQPQFMPQPESNSYAPFMDYGGAVGGTPQQSEKTIDDVFYTIGDKMVHYSGS